ncbi:MAG: lysophospholipid acyltransferase family protein [Chloroflexota bacterium]
MLKYVLFWVIFRILGLLPLRALYAIADVVAAVAYRVAPRARANVYDNLRHIMPDAPKSKVRKAAKQVFRSVAYYYADFAHMPKLDVQDFFDNRIVFYNVREALLPVLATGQGAIMLSAHIGNAELAMQAMLPFGAHMVAVTEPIEPPQLSRLMNRMRSAPGHEFLPVGVTGVKHLIKGLREGKALALMGDRDIEGPRMWLPFFGQETWMPTGPIELGLRTNSPIFPCFSVRRGRFKMVGWLEDALDIQRTDDFQADVRTATLQYLALLEKRLRDDPGDWLVLERVWDSPQTAEQAANAEQVAA